MLASEYMSSKVVMSIVLTVDTMNQFKRHILLHFLSGQNQLPFKTKNPFAYIPSIIALILTVFCSVKILTKKFKLLDFNDALVLHFTMSVHILPISVATIECFRMKNGSWQLLKTFARMMNRLESRLAIKVDWSCLRKQMICNAIGVAFSSFFLIFYRLVFRSTFYGHWFEFWTSIPLVYRIASMLHIMFYVDLVTFGMSSMVVGLDTLRKKRILTNNMISHPNEIRNIVNFVKLHHLQIWQCCQVINKYFGFIFIAIILDSVVTITNAAYWAFVYWMRGESFIITMRNLFNYEYFYYIQNVFFCQALRKMTVNVFLFLLVFFFKCPT